MSDAFREGIGPDLRDPAPERPRRRQPAAREGSRGLGPTVRHDAGYGTAYHGAVEPRCGTVNTAATAGPEPYDDLDRGAGAEAARA
ncbi:hypothetical protein ACGF1Z_02170 [Streptomyces sp. NPDC048018]|uniref:hypothetical protein n=1 Tax=Streptomyces sp. NPDC048018 TaxID=3365499 RepID=UPI00371F0DC8